MPANTLTITDNRTGKTYEVPIEHDTIKADALRQIKVNPGDFGMMTYDPAFMNTASCKSAITYIDGDVGILQYRGIPIEQLAEQSTYLETAYLIMYGELPTKEQLATWTYEITHHTFLHENIKHIMQAFRYDAHPMGMFISIVAAMSTFYPEARNVKDPEVRLKQIYRLIGKVPTVAAFTYRHHRGLPYVYPDNDLELSWQLPQHVGQDDRGKVPAQPGQGARAGHPLYPARRSRAELRHQRHARHRLVDDRSVLGHGGRGGRAVWPAARRRE